MLSYENGSVDCQKSELNIVQQDNYQTLVILTAVAYDYVLTFSNEIEYIWSKPWTWVSTLFILVRYVGLYVRIYLLDGWTFVIFLGAADFVMILRVWAIYNRSRLILASDPSDMSVSTFQILDLTFCGAIPNSPIWAEVADIFQITHGAAMCILTVVQFAKQSLQMYRISKQWHLNRYMNLLVRQGIFYFFACVLVSSFPSVVYTAVQVRKNTNQANGNLPLQHLSVCPLRYI
ncbi:hypothetical protein OG21DRAFT_203068 [Imleria badia]|nr:hypothetical protein OG21DRAFT_203068 [Imleria badia]